MPPAVAGPVGPSLLPRAVVSAAITLAVWAPGVAAPAVHPDEVVLLKYPYPYQAALTIASDTHVASVETFTAVHTLINSTEWIARGSPAWRLLFTDPAIDQRAVWREGISGFGLPIADSCWFYHPVTGVYLSFDEHAHAPVPHIEDSVDFRVVVDSWIRRGWVDTLHTPGEGPISRSAMKAGLDWLAEEPYRHLQVWSNHTYTETPTCLGPAGLSALPLVLKNLAKTFTMGMCAVGGERLARKIAANPYPSPFPQGQRGVGYVLATLLLGCVLWLLYCLVRPRARPLRHFSLGGLALGGVLAALLVVKLDFCEGDNPKSPLYCADLIRHAGFRFFWLLPGAPGYQPEIPGTLTTPEWSYGTQRAGLCLVTLDDGKQAFAFPRCYLGDRGLQSLALLTDAGLKSLCDRKGMSILYTHWADAPREVFDSTGLDGLDLLRRYRDQGRVWVEPTSAVLHFSFIRTFLRYSSRVEDGRRLIEIDRIADPTGDPFVPSLQDLRGLSFDSPSGTPIEVRLAERRVEPSAYELIAAGPRTIVRFPLGSTIFASTTPGADATPQPR